MANVHNLRVVRDWPVIQNKDSGIRKVKNIIRDGTLLSKQSYRMLSANVKLLLRRRKDLYIEHDTLKMKGRYGGRIVVNGTELPLLMRCYHEGQGHLGEDRTVDLIESRFFSKDEDVHCGSCEEVQQMYPEEDPSSKEQDVNGTSQKT